MRLFLLHRMGSLTPSHIYPGMGWLDTPGSPSYSKGLYQEVHSPQRVT